MDNRPNLQAVFGEILGNRNVYFQPPESVKMNYPAIKYSRKQIRINYANDGTYRMVPGYEVILIDPDPDSKYISMILALPYCSYDRHYASDNLNHDVFTLYNY